jgi:mannose-6-phosphate isomerase-like protein (cupin superfamily)
MTMISIPSGLVPDVVGIRRRVRSAKRVQLAGRSARVLASPADGIGDITVTVARIAGGRMNAHEHGPGGEAMYVAAGRGSLWVEGLPISLRAGTAVFAPPGVLHNAENLGTSDLIVVGAFCPGVAPGSYAEQPPRFSPTGKLGSVEGLVRVAGPARRSTADREPRIESLIEDSELSPNIAMRRILVPGGTRAMRPPEGRTRAWVVLRGPGDVISPDAVRGSLGRFDLVALAPGVALTVTAGEGSLTLLEFSARPER